ncbi:RluA family pseudouridine synthase [Polyangium jinanense]|uniref:Pseudouridine synthase n=1 Tax=Polyangium jinanense TaxID=2829994 RepID=A0A9X3X9Z9_9BACT|nr:RluA family pseudouridine synthase [Polyangium jinanense]MDC3959454.1 RluA family pseudouridine synthase [Polyangium jinanense]MDC3984888.1 RluA family pseudouridine synthase [Polyangium jinanense]
MRRAPEPLVTSSFEASATDPRDRLDKLVVRLLEKSGTAASRAAVQRWIENGRVLVDGKPGRASMAVAAGARIDVTPEPPEPSRAEPDASIPLAVVYEDAHLVVIDKPAGLVVHPAKGHASGTLVNALLGRGGFERAGADPRDPEGHLRPGIVHRLDKDTSGLLVVAKDAETREALKACFAKHDIEREYVAVVVGEAKEATFETLHGRHPTDRLRFTTHVQEGKRAVTRVHVLERLGPATLVACRLETGRTHQIRVHLSERGKTPILGDALYGKPPRDPGLRAIAESLGRQALHARVLGFEHPATGNRLHFESPIPADMARVIEALRRAC